MCLAQVLRVQEQAIWANSSTLTVYDGLLSFIVHSKPKVSGLTIVQVTSTDHIPTMVNVTIISSSGHKPQLLVTTVFHVSQWCIMYHSGVSCTTVVYHVPQWCIMYNCWCVVYHCGLPCIADVSCITVGVSCVTVVYRVLLWCIMYHCFVSCITDLSCITLCIMCHSGVSCITVGVSCIIVVYHVSLMYHVSQWCIMYYC